MALRYCGHTLPTVCGMLRKTKIINRNVGMPRDRPGRHKAFIKSHPERAWRDGQEMGFRRGL